MMHINRTLLEARWLNRLTHICQVPYCYTIGLVLTDFAHRHMCKSRPLKAAGLLNIQLDDYTNAQKRSHLNWLQCYS